MALKDIPKSPDAAPPRKNIKLKFLDGLRGLAALYVVIHHCYFKILNDHPPAFFSFLLYGKFAVDIFIVLSGFLLMLPVAMSLSQTMEGGIGPYIQRRAMRILPPYFAALIYSVFLIVAGSLVGGKGGTRSVGADLTAGSLISHLFLVHNVVPQWANQINSPMWSVATEWQIYFVFPLLLLPIWKKTGLWGPFVAAAILGIGPKLLKQPWAESAESWLLVLFTMGLAAAVQFSRMVKQSEDLPALQKQANTWGIAGLVIFAGIVAALVIQPNLYFTVRWLLDCFMGCAAACLILYCAPAAHLSALPKPIPLRIMESKFALWIGLFSYSLYLTHGPLLAVIAMLLKKKLHMGVTPNLLILIFIGTPICMAFGYLFYMISERPFMRKKQGLTPITNPAPEIALAPSSGGSAV